MHLRKRIRVPSALRIISLELTSSMPCRLLPPPCLPGWIENEGELPARKELNYQAARKVQPLKINWLPKVNLNLIPGDITVYRILSLPDKPRCIRPFGCPGLPEASFADSCLSTTLGGNAEGSATASEPCSATLQARRRFSCTQNRMLGTLTIRLAEATRMIAVIVRGTNIYSV